LELWLRLPRGDGGRVQALQPPLLLFSEYASHCKRSAAAAAGTNGAAATRTQQMLQGHLRERGSMKTQQFIASQEYFCCLHVTNRALPNSASCCRCYS
jgi:hypothetical protein